MPDIKVPNRRWADEVVRWVDRQLDTQRLCRSHKEVVPRSSYDGLAERLAGLLTEVNPGCDFTGLYE